MTRRYGFARATLGALLVCAFLVCASIQLASDALNAAAAQQSSLPTFIPQAFGLAVYRALDRIAPASYVEATLASQALAARDLSTAQYYALRMPAIPARNELLANIADDRGEPRLAYEYYFAAADVATLQQRIGVLAAHDAPAAYLDEHRLKDQLITLRTHPDAVAESYWILGEIATQECTDGKGCDKSAALENGLREYRQAIALAPLNVKYALSAANQQLDLGDYRGAQRTFKAGLNVDPASADMIAGLGIVSLKQNDRASAQTYAARARAVSPQASELLWLERLLK